MPEGTNQAEVKRGESGTPSDCMIVRSVCGAAETVVPQLPETSYSLTRPRCVFGQLSDLPYPAQRQAPVHGHTGPAAIAPATPQMCHVAAAHHQSAPNNRKPRPIARHVVGGMCGSEKVRKEDGK